jgi:ABC-type Fe3+-hydroxamate transport system substrate-binding protein
MSLPLRIVSLVPSQTELLFELGLRDEVVGITKFCVHPAAQVAGKRRVGGTKTVHLERVAALKPTLILANKEENTRADVGALQAIAPVHLTDVPTLPAAYAMLREVGQLVGKAAEAAALVGQIEAAFAAMPRLPQPHRVAYLIWRNPWMVAGSGTFIHAMLTHTGAENAFALQVRYPAITAADLAAAQPDYVFLSSEPYPFRAKHIAEVQAICPQAQVRLVDGELFSWYGSRMLHFPAYFTGLTDIS